MYVRCMCIYIYICIFEIEKERDEQFVVSSVLFRVNSRGWIGNRRQNNLGRVSRPIVQHFVSRREILDGKRERGDGLSGGLG